MLKLSNKSIQFIKTTFNVTFIAIISIEFLREAFLSIPYDWLFFLTSDAIENFVFVLMAYGLYYYVFKLNSIWKKIGFVVLFIFLLIGLASLKDFRIHNRIEFEQSFEYFTSFLGKLLLFYLGIYFINRLAFLNRYKKLEKELKQAKEQLLRNQLHPHFLFNAFNSLYSLSLKNHPETSDYILKLSSMMRYLTDESHLRKVPLNTEIGFIKKYIDIEKMRFGKDASIQLITNENVLEEVLIAPFLLIILVENAFKHGFYTNSKDAFVKIKVNIENDELLFFVENSIFKKQHFQESNREGKGLENLKQRLFLLYPKCSSIKTINTGETYTAQLKISLT